MLTYSS